MKTQMLRKWKQRKKSSHSLLHRRRLIITSAVAAAMGLVVVCVCFFINQSAKYRMETEGWIYEYGDKYGLSKGSVFWLDEENGEAYIEHKSSKQILDGIPIYLESGSEQFLEPIAMIYKDPRRKVYGKLRAATKVTRQNGPYLAEYKGKSVELDRGFLFDGSNIYVFLEEVSIEFNSREKKIPPMSYVKAVPGSQIEIFDYSTKEFLMEDLMGEVSAVCTDYTVSLTGDSLINADGTREILANQPSMLFSLME